MRTLAAAIVCCVAAVTAGDARTAQPLPELITPSDTRFIPPTRAIVASGLEATTRCQIAVQFADDTAIVVIHNVMPGMVIPLRIVRVMATGTTCPDVAVIRAEGK